MTENPHQPPGRLRVSDVDRDAAVSELSEHFQAGRLGTIPAIPVEPRPGHDVL